MEKSYHTSKLLYFIFSILLLIPAVLLSQNEDSTFYYNESYAPLCHPEDCNNNNIIDSYEIDPPQDESGYTFIERAYDYNNNNIPDECEVDCNNNNIPDDYDLNPTIGSSDYYSPIQYSYDYNGNNIPDECESDCNHNNIPDDYDVGYRPENSNYGYVEPYGYSADYNNNNIPDECEADCNNNNYPDDYDLEHTAIDNNNDGIIDVCQRENTSAESKLIKISSIYASSTYSENVTLLAENAIDGDESTLWAGKFHEDSYHLQLYLEKKYRLTKIEIKSYGNYRPLETQIETSVASNMFYVAKKIGDEWENSNHTATLTTELQHIEAENVLLTFPKSSGKTVIVYEVLLYGYEGIGEDCNNNEINDIEELRENKMYHASCPSAGYCNDVPTIDINGNEIIDTCEVDCNNNNVPDSHELEESNRLQEVCLNDYGSPTCYNFVPVDFNNNNILDACEADCNNNKIADSVEIFNQEMLEEMCLNDNYNPNCYEYIRVDQNHNNIPDSCEADCNRNKIPDDFEIEQNRLHYFNYYQFNGFCNSPNPHDCVVPILIDANDDGQIDTCQFCPLHEKIVPVKVLSNSQYENFYPAKNLILSDNYSFWAGTYQQGPSDHIDTIDIDLGAAQDVFYVETDWLDHYGAKFTLSISTDNGSTYTRLYEQNYFGEDEERIKTLTTVVETQGATNIRLEIYEPSSMIAILSQIRIFGIPNKVNACQSTTVSKYLDEQVRATNCEHAREQIVSDFKESACGEGKSGKKASHNIGLCGGANGLYNVKLTANVECACINDEVYHD